MKSKASLLCRDQIATALITTSLLLMAFAAQAVDIFHTEVLKGQRFVQASAGSPVPAAGNSFVFHALARPTLAQWVTNPTVKHPPQPATRLR